MISHENKIEHGSNFVNNWLKLKHHYQFLLAGTSKFSSEQLYLLNTALALRLFLTKKKCHNLSGQ